MFGQTYDSNGFNVADAAVSGVYYVIENNGGCNFVKKLTLTVLAAPLTADIKYDTIESGEIYTYKGIDYTESAVIKDTLYNILGPAEYITAGAAEFK